MLDAGDLTSTPLAGPRTELTAAAGAFLKYLSSATNRGFRLIYANRLFGCVGCQLTQRLKLPELRADVFTDDL